MMMERMCILCTPPEECKIYPIQRLTGQARHNIHRAGVTFEFHHSSQYFPRQTVFYGKMVFVPVRRAANCMDNLNTKDTILFVDDEQVILDVGTLMIEELGYKVL